MQSLQQSGTLMTFLLIRLLRHPADTSVSRPIPPTSWVYKRRPGCPRNRRWTKFVKEASDSSQSWCRSDTTAVNELITLMITHSNDSKYMGVFLVHCSYCGCDAISDSEASKSWTELKPSH